MTERAARNPDVLVATLARIIRAIAEREAAEKAERRAKLAVVEQRRGGQAT